VEIDKEGIVRLDEDEQREVAAMLQSPGWAIFREWMNLRVQKMNTIEDLLRKEGKDGSFQNLDNNDIIRKLRKRETELSVFKLILLTTSSWVNRPGGKNGQADAARTRG
jgi:hypothetical protein